MPLALLAKTWVCRKALSVGFCSEEKQRKKCCWHGTMGSLRPCQHQGLNEDDIQEQLSEDDRQEQQTSQLEVLVSVALRADEPTRAMKIVASHMQAHDYLNGVLDGSHTSRVS